MTDDIANTIGEWRKKFPGRVITNSVLAKLLGTESPRWADLSDSDLSYTRLSGISLSTVSLNNANLSFSQLDNINLHGAHLDGVNLNGSTLTNCKIPGYLRDISARYTVFDGIDNRSTTNNRFVNCDLTGATIVRAHDLEFKPSTKLLDTTIRYCKTATIQRDSLEDTSISFENANLVKGDLSCSPNIFNEVWIWPIRFPVNKETLWRTSIGEVLIGKDSIRRFLKTLDCSEISIHDSMAKIESLLNAESLTL